MMLEAMDVPAGQSAFSAPLLTRAAVASPEPAQTGIPILVGLDGSGQALARVSLAPRGQGAFDEAWLQRLVHENPICLPIQEIDPGLHGFSAICRELNVAGGYVDNLLMTGRGDIAIVETKLFRNPEARRTVLAQILDYATCLFAMTYAQFEHAILTSTFAPGPKPASLYDALPEAEKLAQPAFIDAVQHNLQRGRALLLVVGDGIRNEAERLIEGTQSYGSFGFTLALVELAVFRMPGAGGFMVRPRTLAKTAITQRTIIEVSGTGIVSAKEVSLPVPETLSSGDYWDLLETKAPGARAAIEDLIKKIEPLGVYPEMLASLNLKWQRPAGGRPVNLAYVKKNGNVWFDASTWFARKDLALTYIEEVAALFGGQSHCSESGTMFSVFKNGKAIHLSSMLSHLDDWIGPIKRFIEAVARADAAEEETS